MKLRFGLFSSLLALSGGLSGCSAELEGPLLDEDVAALGTLSSALEIEPEIATQGNIPRLVGLRFIRMRANESDNPPIWWSRVNAIINGANRVYSQMNLQFYAQWDDNVVMPHLALGTDAGGSLAWSDIWEEVSQIAPVDANTYAGESTSPSAWLHRIGEQLTSPLTATVWVAQAGYANQAARTGNTVLLRDDVQDSSRDNFAHELGHWLNLIHNHASPYSPPRYPTPPHPDDDPANACIHWDLIYIPAAAANNPEGRNRYFRGRSDCEAFIAGNGISLADDARWMSINGAGNRCPDACIDDHQSSECADIAVCWYEADSATDQLGMKHDDEWIVSGDRQPGTRVEPLDGVSRAKNGRFGYNIMAYSPITSWNNEHILAESQVEAIEQSFLHHGRVAASCAGQTAAGSTHWVQYDSTGVYVDVNTSECGFTEAPLYFTSLGGGAHWATRGASSVYEATATGFRVYVKAPSGITVERANQLGWHINWQAHPNGLERGTLCTGQDAAWEDSEPNVIQLDVDSSRCGFAAVPNYFTSLGGNRSHWDTRGATSIVTPTETGFTVYVHQSGISAAKANDWGWHLNWKAIEPDQQFANTCTGRAVGGANGTWLRHNGDGIYMDVDTSACTDFTDEPLVFTSLAGDGGQAIVHGTTSIYDPTPTGFRVYIQKSNITPARANDEGWTVEWSLHPRYIRRPVVVPPLGG